VRAARRLDRNGLRYLCEVRSAMASPIRLYGEHGLRFAVRLSDDCYRSVAVWAEGAVKEQLRV
jgi:hypothetical protein